MKHILKSICFFYTEVNVKQVSKEKAKSDEMSILDVLSLYEKYKTSKKDKLSFDEWLDILLFANQRQK